MAILRSTHNIGFYEDLTKIIFHYHQMSLFMRKPAFYLCENKDTDQLRSNCAADQRLCFRYTDSTIPLLPKSEILTLQPSSVAIQPGLCLTWSETLKTVFFTTRLKYHQIRTSSLLLIPYVMTHMKNLNKRKTPCQGLNHATLICKVHPRY